MAGRGARTRSLQCNHRARSFVWVDMDGFAGNFELPLDATSRDAVDGWVRLALRRHYDAVLTEAPSPELAELLGLAPANFPGPSR